MVFFNYSTMQMAAKVVYYGPGLCGKTTNLQYIYSRTSNDSRGEMVSLETETDRTLFFDLLPIDVGSIAGFSTRVQLYTVPGQVFYNTTRKLVLKGVDGVVFVADSQRPMLQANIDSFKNLEENLQEMGLSMDTMPLVLQYNKRDLADICSVEELNQALNRNDWPHVEASALTGQGVFETLKSISKLTLVSLKRRLAKGQGGSRPASRPAARPAPAAPATPPGGAPPPAAPAPPGAAPAPAPPPPAAVSPTVSPPSASPTPPVAATSAPKPASPPKPAPSRARKPKGGSDVLAELEKIRRQALTQPVPSARTNGRHEINREIQLTLNKADFDRSKRFLLNLQVEDGQNQVVDSVRDFQIDLGDLGDHEKVLLKLNIALRSR